MKKYNLLQMLCAIFFSFSLQAAVNLLKNPSFENGLSPWETASWLKDSTVKPVTDSAMKCDGQASMRLDIIPDKFAYVSQLISIPEGTRDLTFSFKVRLSGLGDGWTAVTQMVFYDQKYKVLKRTDAYGSSGGDRRDVWLPFQRVMKLPERTRAVTVILRAHHHYNCKGRPDAKGSVWFDDLRLYSGRPEAKDAVIPAKASSWKLENAAAENLSDGLRLRVSSAAGGKQGGVSMDLMVPSEDHYMQIRMGDRENDIVAPSCWNREAKLKIGMLHPGVNTFKVPASCAGRQFRFALRAFGDPRAKTGPWFDFKELRTTLEPWNAPVVELVSGSRAEIGSILRISLRVREKLAAAPVVRFCLIPQFVDYRFNSQDRISLVPKSDGLYEAEVKIDRNAISYQSSASSGKIVALVTLDGVDCYYTLPFSVDVKTANRPYQDLMKVGSIQVRDARKLWLQRIQGQDLALGKSLVFVPQPDYPLTKDAKDRTDLTRGKLSSRGDDHIWFDRDAVGWFGDNNQIYLKLDLGQEQPVEKMVVRLIGGTTSNFRFPRNLTLYASRDGKLYHRTAALEKLAPGESSQCDWQRFYYLDESASDYNTRMYPFELPVGADARYLILHVTGDTGWVFSDALACIRAEKKSGAFNAAYRQPGREIPMEGVIIRPRVQQLAVMQGLPAPQRFSVVDMRPPQQRKETTELVLELPKGISVIGYQGQAAADGGQKYVIELKNGRRGPVVPPLYLAAPGKVAGTALVYARSAGVDQFKTRLPVLQLMPPKLGEFKRLHVSLAWMSQSEDWPDFLNQWRRLGFNAVSTFPRYWSGKSLKKNTDFVAAAHKAGYKIIANESPFHVMEWRNRGTDEFYCRIPGRKHKMLCPTYRGEYYQKEMNRIRECIRLSRPDYVFWDIECWHQAQASSASCQRCREALAKSGGTMLEHLRRCGRETVSDLRKSVELGARDAGIPMPLIASYHRQPLSPVFCIEHWKDIYPELISWAQPSLYVSGRALDVHENIRENYRLLKERNLVPWLTAGCYGEYDSFKLEQMILEALMNGAGGITYYAFWDFDTPLDFYYHAKALAEIQPYENLILDGDMVDVSGSNPDLTYSMIQKDGEILLLVGNYLYSAEKTVVKLPFAPSEVLDLRENEKVKAEQNFAFQVPRGQIRLFHFRK